MGLEFDALVRGEDMSDERERDSILTFAMALLAGSVSLVINVAIHRPDCLGRGALQCWSEWSVTPVPYMLLGLAVAGFFGAFVLWTTRRGGSGLSDRALAWGVVPVVALSVGAASMIRLMILLPFFGPAMISLVTAIAAVVSASEWWEIRRGRREPTSSAALVAPAGIPLVTVTRRPPSVPMRWVARYLWIAPLGLLLSVVLDLSDSSNGDTGGPGIYLIISGAFLVLTAISCALSYAAYRAVHGGSSVARGLVLGFGLIVFAAYGILGWGLIVMSVGGLRPASYGGIVMLVSALVGVGAIVWYVVGVRSGGNRPVGSSVDS